MNPITRLPVLAMLALIAGFVSAPMFAQQPPAPPMLGGKSATVYFFRTANQPEDVVGLLLLDGVEIGQVFVRQFTVIPVRPGNHELKLSFPIWADVGDQSVSMEFEQNKSYYFSYTSHTGEAEPSPAAGAVAADISPEIKRVAEADAKPFLAKYERVLTDSENAAKKAPTSVADTSATTDNADHATSEQNDPLVRLEPVFINETSQLSFHFSVRIMRTKDTHQLVAMYVDRVLDGSNAQAVGLLPGARIVAIEGKPVEKYAATFRNGSELRQILINRNEGAQVALVVISPGDTQPRQIVVTRRTLVWK